MLRVGIVGTNFISDWFVAAARRTNGRIAPFAVYSRTDGSCDSTWGIS